MSGSSKTLKLQIHLCFVRQTVVYESCSILIKKKNLFSSAWRLVPKENTEHGFSVVRWKGNGA